MPGPVSRDAGELARAIGAGAASAADVAAFRAKFIVPLDGGCTRRIVSLALGAEPAQLI